MEEKGREGRGGRGTHTFDTRERSCIFLPVEWDTFRSRRSYGTGAVTLALPRALAPTTLKTSAVVDHAPLGCAIKAGLPPPAAVAAAAHVLVSIFLRVRGRLPFDEFLPVSACLDDTSIAARTSEAGSCMFTLWLDTLLCGTCYLLGPYIY